MSIDETKLDELVDKYKKELESVEPKYHNEFIEFVETGEASEEFHKYVDSNKQCQEVIDKILNRQAEAIREFGKMLRNE